MSVFSKPGLTGKLKRRCDDLILIGFRKAVEKRKAHQTITDRFRYRAVACLSSIVNTHDGQMKRQVVKHTENMPAFKVRDESRSCIQSRHQKIEHVIRLFALCRNNRQADLILLRPVGQMFRGVDIDVAVRNTHATLHRINYHMTLVGKIIFLAAPL